MNDAFANERYGEFSRRGSLVQAAILTAFLLPLLPNGAAAQPYPQSGRRIETPRIVEELPGAHQGRHPKVTDFALSADGRRLAACYYVQAMNRSGTDWRAWAAAWDLNTSKRTIIEGVEGALALSPDGQMLVVGGTLWKWRAGQAEQVSEPPLLGKTIRCWAFSADGTELLGVTPECTLIVWTLANGTEREIALSNQAEDLKAALGIYCAVDRWANLYVMGNEAHLLAATSSRQPGGPEKLVNAEALELVWRKSDQGWVHARAGYFYRYSVGWDVLNCVLRAYPAPRTFRLTRAQTARLYETFARAQSDYGLSSAAVAVAPQERLIAFLEPGSDLAVLRGIDGAMVRGIPAVGVHAFTPDGKQLIVSERTGVLRFVDVDSGKIIRSLRLDNQLAETVRVAAIQAASEFNNPEANRKKLGMMIEYAAKGGAQIVVLPEAAVTGYADYDLKRVWRTGERALSEATLMGVDPRDVAETVPGPSTRAFGKLAQRYGIYLTVPLVEIDRKTGRYYNSVVLLGPAGEKVMHYRKINPWPWAETGWASTGDFGHPIADTLYGRLGLLICFDIHEQAAQLAEQKVDTLLYSIAWVDEADSDWFSRRLPEIARTDAFNIIGANWTLPDGTAAPPWHGYGQSTIIDAHGAVLATADKDIGDTIVFADLPLPTDDDAARDGE